MNDDNGVLFFRAFMYALILAVPFWLVVIGLILEVAK